MNSESHLDFPKEDPAQPRFMAQYYMNTEANMVDALKVFYPDTFVDTHNNGKRIDYVYVSPYTSQRLLDCHVEVNDPFVSNLTASGVDKFMIPSDHRPIVLDIKIK